MSNISSNEPSGDIEKHQISRFIPLNDISGNVMIYRDGSISCGFRCIAPVAGLLPYDTRSNLYTGLATALRMLPPEINVQFCFGQESRLNDIAKKLDASKITDPTIKLAVESRNQVLLNGVKNGDLRVTTLDIYLSLPPVVAPKELSRRVRLLEKEMEKQRSGAPTPSGIASFFAPLEAILNGIFSPMKGAVVLTYEEYQKSRDKLTLIAEGFVNSLFQSNLSPTPLTAEEILRRYYRKWNPSKFEAGLDPRPFSTTGDYPITEHFLHSAFDWDPKGERVEKGMFYLDGYYHQVLTMLMPPERMFFPHLESTILYSGLHKMEIVVNMFPFPVAERIKALQDEKKSIIANKKEETNQGKLAQISDLIAKLGNGEEKLWQAQHIIVLRAKTPTELRTDTSALLGALKKDGGTDMSEEVHAVFDYWMASQPGFARDKDNHRHNKYTTHELVDMLPVFGSTQLNPNHPMGVTFQTTHGAIRNINLEVQEEMTAPNALVIGGSGVGKSVLVNTILTHLSRLNPRVVLVDVGASYRRLCSSLNGTFIEYDIRSTACRINPFDCYSKGSAEADELQSTIMLLEKMVWDAKEVPALNNAQRTAFEDGINTLVNQKKGQEFYLNDLRELLARQDNKISQDLALRLARYCRGGGGYANLFDGPTNAPLTSRFTVFELQRVKESAPELLPIVFQVILQHTVSLATNYPEDSKILAMDEAHVLLEDPALRRFVELAYRTFRKRGVAVLGISQGIDDWIIEGSKPRAIIDNVFGLFICSQKDNGVRVGETYSLSPNEVAAISNIRYQPGHFSEFVFINFSGNGRQSTVCSNILSPVEYAMFTSSGVDTRVMYKWVADGLTMSEAIERFSQEYPQGVARGRRPEPSTVNQAA